ncbi:FixH family protein [Salinimonas chungwhensis]|uniref:FixH family protein n=1 Tax=Salinimonas chungwhensis TaxID=265425 RepID=UPI0003627C83|nr:FixH family protein [Salinimonas chungwhensis]
MEKPWYKQFWPWFLIAVPAITMIMSGVLLNLAISTEDSLVVDNYYKQGKAINASLAKEHEARRRNISADVTIDDGAIALQFHSGIPRDGQAIRLSFYHTTQQSKDFSVLLSRDASGMYRGFSENMVAGKWQMTLEPINSDWKIRKQIWLPAKQTISLKP